jgi:hypothetical protein
MQAVFVAATKAEDGAFFTYKGQQLLNSPLTLNLKSDSNGWVYRHLELEDDGGNSRMRVGGVTSMARE